MVYSHNLRLLIAFVTQCASPLSSSRGAGSPNAMSACLVLSLLLLPLVSSGPLSGTMDRIVDAAQWESMGFLAKADVLLEVTQVTAAWLAGEEEEAFEKVDAALAFRTLTFNETARAVDGAETHLKVGALERVLAEVEGKRRRISDGPQAAEAFKKAYLRAGVVLGDALDKSLAAGSRDDLFLRVARLTGHHQPLTADFIKDVTLMRVQAFVVDATFRHLEFNSSAVDARVASKFRAELAAVLRRGRDVEAENEAMVRRQVGVDLRHLHHRLQDLSHCQFAAAVRRSLEEKFPRLTFAVVSYEPVLGFSKHAFIGCSGAVLGHVFRVAGRNSVAAGFPRRQGRERFLEWARRKLAEVGDIKADGDYAKEVLRRVGTVIGGHCGAGKEVLKTAIITSAAQCSSAGVGNSAKTKVHVYDCNTRLCWIKRHYYFTTTLFG